MLKIYSGFRIYKQQSANNFWIQLGIMSPVSYTHLRAHETVLDLVCRLLLEQKNNDILTICIRKYIHNTYFTMTLYDISEPTY